jgi:hypothetical protein
MHSLELLVKVVKLMGLGYSLDLIIDLTVESMQSRGYSTIRIRLGTTYLRDAIDLVIAIQSFAIDYSQCNRTGNLFAKALPSSSNLKVKLQVIAQFKQPCTFQIIRESSFHAWR